MLHAEIWRGNTMQLKIFSIAGIGLFLIFASGVILAQVQEGFSVNKEGFAACLQHIKENKKDTIHDIKELYKTEKERFSNPKNAPALRAARINRKNDIQTAKDVFKISREECESLFH
jgi:hypothetical protein